MNESTKTKKALRGSLFALFLCIVLLIGTTFAWFTDTASTGVNKIQSGKLDVGLEYKAADGSWKDATKAPLNFQKASASSSTIATRIMTAPPLPHLCGIITAPL